MLWRNLRLQTRMLIGYGLILVLIVILGLLLLFRVTDLNGRLRRLSAEVTAEATTSTHLAAQVATTQQLIDRYLQQPQEDNLDRANGSLDALATALKATEVLTLSQQQHAQVAAIGTQLTAYRNRFQTLSPLIQTQASLRQRIATQLLAAQNTLSDITAQHLQQANADPSVITALLDSLEDLQRSTYRAGRLVSEQDPEQATTALEALAAAESALRASRPQLSPSLQQRVDTLLGNTLRSTVALTQYRSNIEQVQRQRSILLDNLGDDLGRLTDIMTNTALGRLSNATADLEQQSQQAQQITGGTVLLTLLIVLVFGIWLPRSISGPLLALVAATRRINAGDYRLLPPSTDRSEIGELTTSFNTMIGTLSQQRAEVQRQQGAIEAQYGELSRALLALQASTEAREQLASTVRKLSVPVMPILRRVILIPLVGEIDAERAALLREQLLAGVQEAGARMVILDITGVPLVDSQLVEWLISATSAARLLGAQCILVGIRPEVAQALVASGANLETLVTRANLRHAVEYSARAEREGTGLWS